MDGEMAFGRAKYNEDYEIRTVEVNGKTKKIAVYKGTKYVFSADADTMKKRRRNLLLLCIAGLVSFFAAGFFDTGATREFYVALPYVFAFLPWCLCLLGLYHLFGVSAQMTRKEVDQSIRPLSEMSIAAAILCGAALTGTIVYWALKGFAAADIGFASGVLLMGLAACGIRLIARSCAVTAVPKEKTAVKV